MKPPTRQLVGATGMLGLRVEREFDRQLLRDPQARNQQVTMRRVMLLIVVCAALAACDSAGQRDTAQIGTPERDARDSVIGQSKLPGAPAVERARDVQATAKERAAALDSIQ